MLKPSLIYVITTILVVLCAKYLHIFIVYIDIFYAKLQIYLAPFMNHNGVSLLVTKIILLVIIPVAIAAIPALIYRVIKGKKMPYFLELTWCLWLIIVLSNLLIR